MAATWQARCQCSVECRKSYAVKNSYNADPERRKTRRALPLRKRSRASASRLSAPRSRRLQVHAVRAASARVAPPCRLPPPPSRDGSRPTPRFRVGQRAFSSARSRSRSMRNPILLHRPARSCRTGNHIAQVECAQHPNRVDDRNRAVGLEPRNVRRSAVCTDRRSASTSGSAKGRAASVRAHSPRLLPIARLLSRFASPVGRPTRRRLGEARAPSIPAVDFTGQKPACRVTPARSPCGAETAPLRSRWRRSAAGSASGIRRPQSLQLRRRAG